MSIDYTREWRNPIDPEPPDGMPWMILTARDADIREVIAEIREHLNSMEAQENGTLE